MKVKNFVLQRKFLLLNIILIIYIATNLIGGERGLISYFNKKNIESIKIEKKKKLLENLKDIEKKNILISVKQDKDFLDLLYREKLRYGKKGETIIRLNNYEN
tara:strand:+ start:113 stop:421 length:309 start_codon:yes stop_codon:yes gene_type:complete